MNLHYKQLTLAILLLVIVIPVLGNSLRQQSSQLVQQQQQQQTEDKKPVYYCNAVTKKGTPCKHRVKKQGDRCWQHQGK